MHAPTESLKSFEVRLQDVRKAAVALVLAALLAGCFGGGGKGGGGGDASSSSTSAAPGASTSTAAPGQPSVTFTWSPTTPTVGREVAFTATAKDLGARTVKSSSWDFGDGGTGSGLRANHTFAKAGDAKVRVTVTLSDGKALASSATLFVLNTAGAPGPAPNATVPPPAAIPGVFECADGPVVEPNETFGTDDALPALSWAVLKTGFRLAVAWSSESPSTGSLTYRVGKGLAGEQTLTESAPTKVHLFVVDNLPENATVCFSASMGGAGTATHAVRTVNGPTAFTPAAPHGTYLTNFLVLNNDGGDLAEVEAGVARFASMTWDATDGWVRVGAVLVVSGDYLHHNVGWPTCYVLAIPGACSNVFDVLVTLGASPQGAASTYRQGIRDRAAAIWMNLDQQAVPGPTQLDDFGAVLTHENGHYAFDMDDLYGDNTVITSECFDSGSGISIMAGSREATEFDDPAAPCPNQPAGYTTSWELLQGQFTQVEDRPDGPLRGPTGDGGLFFQRTYRAT